eukprot:TRINITY_DN6042_c0_g1_i2.p1 TRINITY_DN6042_c0_g1~~TRINITY_DN6042_c0_g1_i2.p1  ORF type:complete len:700 (-),score=142.62 TRINITY_DN6042_c0_g1_i2:45-2144(-)
MLRCASFTFARLNIGRAIGALRCYQHKPTPSAAFIELEPRRETNQLDMKAIDPKYIRNFSIIAHIDHGKSTLADRLMEITGTLPKGQRHAQYLDKLQVERERGITVKAQNASLFVKYKGERYLLNLIDTPGHVDFTYEVSRSLAACQGCLLLVDCMQGIQAQTLANFHLAKDNGCKIIPVINKVDMDAADVNYVMDQLEDTLEFDREEVLLASGKSGIGTSDILAAVIERIPPPSAANDKPPRILLFDSWFDTYRGVICMVELFDGYVKKGWLFAFLIHEFVHIATKRVEIMSLNLFLLFFLLLFFFFFFFCLETGDIIESTQSREKYEVQDVGIMYPEEKSTSSLYAGQVGYLVCGMKKSVEAKIGDTFKTPNSSVVPLPGFKNPKPMVFSGIYPVESDEFEKLQAAIEKLTLNDSSVTMQKESSDALGLGFRCGFLGLLHMSVFHQRLEQEYNANVIGTPPTVPYEIVSDKDDKVTVVENPSQFPSPQFVKEYREPFVTSTIIAPTEYVGPLLSLCQERRGEQVEMTYLGPKRVLLKYLLPLNEIVVDFYDELKSVSSGYASFDYEPIGYRKSQIVKLDICLNGKPVDALATIVHKDHAEKVGRKLCLKLKDVIQRQLFVIAIQASIGSKVIARETVSAMRKDVTAKCYGGDITRKRKLLEKQKEGKKMMKKIGNIELSKEAFLSILSNNSVFTSNK